MTSIPLWMALSTLSFCAYLVQQPGYVWYNVRIRVGFPSSLTLLQWFDKLCRISTVVVECSFEFIISSLLVDVATHSSVSCHYLFWKWMYAIECHAAQLCPERIRDTPLLFQPIFSSPMKIRGSSTPRSCFTHRPSQHYQHHFLSGFFASFFNRYNWLSIRLAVSYILRFAGAILRNSRSWPVTPRPKGGSTGFFVWDESFSPSLTQPRDWIFSAISSAFLSASSTTSSAFSPACRANFASDVFKIFWWYNLITCSLVGEKFWSAVQVLCTWRRHWKCSRKVRFGSFALERRILALRRLRNIPVIISQVLWFQMYISFPYQLHHMKVRHRRASRLRMPMVLVLVAKSRMKYMCGNAFELRPLRSPWLFARIYRILVLTCRYQRCWLGNAEPITCHVKYILLVRGSARWTVSNNLSRV